MTFQEQVEEITAMQKAPPGKFRVLCVDTFPNPPIGDPFVLADCDTKQVAIDMAKAHGSADQPAYVYDDAGKYIFGAGKS
jgi:hypothetical protein